MAYTLTDQDRQIARQIAMQRFDTESQKNTASKSSNDSWLTSLPSMAAALASLIPGVGTGAAALLGGGGEAISQLLRGKGLNIGDIAKEAALSAIPGGIGKLAKLGKGAKVAETALDLAGDTSKVARAADIAGDASKVASVATDATQANKIAKIRSMFDRSAVPASATANAGEKISTATNSIKAGDMLGDEILTANRASNINKVIETSNSGGIIGKTSRQKLVGVQKARELAQNDIDKSITTAMRTDAEKAIEANRKTITGFDPNDTTHVGIDKVLSDSLATAKTPKQLENLRSQLTATSMRLGDDATSGVTKGIINNYTQAIDGMLEKAAPTISAMSGKVTTLTDAENLLAKNLSKGTGMDIPFVPKALTNTAGSATQAAIDTAGRVIKSAGSNATIPTYGRGLLKQVAGRAGASVVLGNGAVPTDENGNPVDPTLAAASSVATDNGITAEDLMSMAGGGDTTTSTSPFNKEAIQSAILADGIGKKPISLNPLRKK